MDDGVDVSVFCWGSTANGELGLGGIEEDIVLKPKLLTNFVNSSSVQNIACGRYHTLALLKDGTVFSCGNNDFGQLGRLMSRKKLEHVSSFGSHIAWLAACGENHSVVVTTNGEVFSWGSNKFGQLGLSISSEQVSVPKIIRSLAVSHKVIQVACGVQHTLLLTENGLMYSFGNNKYGQIGIGKFGGEGEFSPCVVTSLESLPIYQIAAGSYHSLALTKSGSLFAWGKNEFGQLGIGTTNNREYPTLVKTLKQQKVKYVCCGEDHTAALTNSGGVFTFGAGMYGQLGHNSTNNEVLPRQVIELMGSVVTQIACGRCHTLSYIPTRGRIYAFGLGGNGQLGTGTTSNWTSPTVVNGPWVHHSINDNLKETPWYRPISRLTKQFSEIDVTSNDEPMDWSSNNTINQNSTGSEESFVIHKVVCGGDQSFVLSSQKTHLIQPQDFRFLPVDTQVCTINMALLEELRDVPEDGAVPLDYISHIETTFSTVACLNGSFLTKNLEHYGCISKNCGVDFQLVCHCFDCIRDAKNLTVPELIKNCVKELLPKLPVSPPECEALRIYLILPLCHLFQNPSNTLNAAVELISPFARCILRLDKVASKILDIWWSDLEVTYFKNIVAIFTKSIDVLLSNTLRRHELAEQKHNFLQVLKRLYKVNGDCNEKVPYQEFYIPKITESCDVGEDYLRWLSSDDSPKPSEFFFCDYPFVFDAQAKTVILQRESQIQMDQAFSSAVQQTVYSMLLPSVVPSEPFLLLNVNRDKIVEDTLTELMTKSSSDLKKPLKVTFTGEDAVDAGGVRKEFFLLLLREVLDPKYGMFKSYSETNCIWFNDQTFEDAAMFYMIGIICGLAIYNFTIIDLPFPLALYKKLLSEPVKLEDLCGLSPILAKSLQDLIDYDGDDVESVFCLNFTISVESFDSVKMIDLKENGQDINVTKENKKEYVDCYVDYVLNTSILHLFEAFNNGFHKVCANRVMSLFHAQELMALVIGNEDYQWDLLQENAEYKNEYNPKHPAVIRFWNVFHSLSTQQKKKFLLFLTGSDRIPILGMKVIKIVIQPMNVDDQHLPVAHTCFNILDLPKYSNESILKEKLLLAIENAEGFGLV